MRFGIAIAATAVFALYPAQAQTLKPALDFSSAAKFRDGCLARAAERKLIVATAIFNSDRTLITFAKMDSVPSAIVEIAQWKGISAATFQEAPAENANWDGPAPDMSTWGGGVPFFAEDGSPLGGGGTSGAETDKDIAYCNAGIAAAGMRTKVK